MRLFKVRVYPKDIDPDKDVHSFNQLTVRTFNNSEEAWKFAAYHQRNGLYVTVDAAFYDMLNAEVIWEEAKRPSSRNISVVKDE